MKADNISIHLTIATFIFFVSWTAATDIPNGDLNKSNKSITDDYETTLLLADDEDGEDNEMFNAGVTNRSETELICRQTFEYDDQTFSHCYNDSHCKLYSDCCRDSKFYDKPGQTVAITGSMYNNSRYGCYNKHGLDSVPALLIGRCPRVASLAERDKCEQLEDDFISTYPVSSSDGRHTYKNVWCALCHGERRRVDYWKPLFVCYGPDNRVLPVQVRLENACDHSLLYRDGQWYYADYKNRTLFSCDYKIQPPDATTTPKLRPCFGEGTTGVVDGCPEGTPTAMALACASHTYTLFEYESSDGRERRVFRNADCARCNGLTINQLMCEPPALPFSSKPSLGFGSLFAVSKTGERCNPCSRDEIYDVAAVKCRNVIQEELSGACLNFVTFGQGEYDGQTMSNGTVYVYAYKKRVRYRTGDNPTVAENGTGSLLQVCTDDAGGLLKPYKLSAYRTYLRYASVVGSCVSVAALVAHLVLFGCCGCRINPEPKNLPEKNLASLSTGLLLGYVGYLFNVLQAVSPGKGLSCFLSTFITQFGFQSGFAWMFVMSVDVWIVLHASTKKLRVAGGQRNGRFIVYSMFAWLTPAALIALSATLEWQSAPEAQIHERRPTVYYTCWYRIPRSGFALYVIPSLTFIAANYVSFIGSVWLIATSDNGFKTSSSGGHCSNATTINRTRRNLKIYVRLSLMMGLAWVFWIVGNFADSDVAFTLNAAFNSLQGAFIFLAFDCN